MKPDPHANGEKLGRDDKVLIGFDIVAETAPAPDHGGH
jgi:hypothetical protein